MFILVLKEFRNKVFSFE